MNFEEYLLSKKIDSHAFRAAEETLWESWRKEFEEISPVAFTAQKLFLINPIRRKYQAKIAERSLDKPVTVVGTPADQTQKTDQEISAQKENPAFKKPAVPRPMFKPKPKTNE